MKKQLTHLARGNQPRMVDVSAKRATARTAVARGVVQVPAAVMARLRDGELHGPKGPIFQTAIVAGTMAAKRTDDLIPLCHPLPVAACQITIRARGPRITIEATVRTTHPTGVEMEALTAVSVAALTVYDMCKALTHDIVIREIRLVSKTGGKSDYVARS